MVNLAILLTLSVHGVVPDLFRTTKVIAKEKCKKWKKSTISYFVFNTNFPEGKKFDLSSYTYKFGLWKYILGKAELEGCKTREGVLIGL